MSEEILKALMQLFGLIAKQDDGVQESELDFVETFLKQQLSAEAVEEYYALFKKHSKDKKSALKPEGKVQLTSMKDSVRILGICKKINKQLNKEQKVVVLVRLYELINTDRKFTDQRMAIINTVADVFKFTALEKEQIEAFVINDDLDKLDFEDLLVINSTDKVGVNREHIQSGKLNGNVLILRVKSSNLYFLRYTGDQDIFLNGLLLNSRRIYLFPKGSFIKLPTGTPIYYTDVVGHFMTDSSTPKISYKVNDLGFTFKNGGIGLRDVNIAEEHGRLVGIMGASGAGKTTLLNVLSGTESPTTGTVEINGVNMHTNKDDVEGVIGLIPQDDLLIEELTVFENLYYNAKLCFKDKGEEEINQLVNDTLQSLGLFERRNLKVGSPLNKMISGGQRKRLNIALELIREPAILFVDEPTSGLSSRDSENVMNLLRELTLKGKLIFVVIHQPSSDIFKMFDKMFILDTGGYPVYYGNPSESLIYFKQLDAQINSDQGECPSCGNLNPELLFNIIDANVIDEYGNYTNKRKTSPPEWHKHYKQNITIPVLEEVNDAPPKSLNIPTWIKQFSIYTLRDFWSKVSNKQYLLLNLLEAPVLGFILAFLIRYIVDPESNIYIFRDNQNIPPYIFMGIVVALFFGLIVSAEEIFKDAKILKREAFLNLSRSSYLVSKILILFTISAIQMALFVAVANSILGIQDMYFEFWLALFTVSAFANILGLILSASFNSIVTIYILIPLVMIPQMVLGGAMFTFDKLNRDISSPDKVPFVAEFMPSRYIYEGLIVDQFKHNVYQSQFFEIDQEQSVTDFKVVYYLPELELLLDRCNSHLLGKGENDAKQFKNDLALIQNELSKENKRVSEISFNDISAITVDNFSEELYQSIKNHLATLKSYYSDRFVKANNLKERKIGLLIQKIGKERFNGVKDTYLNESITDIVCKTFETNKLLRDGDKLIQNVEPIYQRPEPEGFFSFRTHFFAPNKHFAGKYYETLWFNIVMVWICTLILYAVLYFDLLRKSFKIISEIKILKK
ncbi:ATP-binding cassette domain-containing protein [Saccharicrinis aurantiacus]|uniref:ATP-binding cassette domain-containing protein n=1 Tax=Saccharicrinis aurantiacus TaxID=1849719 RepID=UPI00249051F3|nr:ATP-binding cassette domain-containing protein [Saccharicrinis aurantiacus]